MPKTVSKTVPSGESTLFDKNMTTEKAGQVVEN
jgi:hypothetical protein